MTIKAQKMLKTVEVWVCPELECGNYFASSTTQTDLSTELAYPRAEDIADFAAKHGQRHKHTRAACPDCREAGRGDVQRVLRRVSVLI